MAGGGEQFVFHPVADAVVHAVEGAVVETLDDALALFGENVGSDLRLVTFQAAAVEFVAHHAKQRGLHVPLFHHPGFLLALRAGDEIHDVLGDVGRDQVASGALHHRQRLRAGHALQAEAMRQQRGHARAPGIELRQEIFAQAEHELNRLALEVENESVVEMLLQSLAHCVGRAMLDDGLQVGGELGNAGGTAGRPLAEGEDFLELVEDDDRSDEAIAGTPEVEVAAMEVFPQRFPWLRAWRVDLGAIKRRGQRGLDLIRQ